MKWTDESVTSAIKSLMGKLNIKRMPTYAEMKNNKMSGLGRAISLTGGIHVWSKKLDVELKKTEKFWNDERIETELWKCINALKIERMPTASELVSLGRNDLHCAISKSSIKYRGWASKLKLSLKSSETVKGNKYEFVIKKRIEEISNHLFVRKMPTKHPYDLLINDCVKIDVKVASPHMLRGENRVHTFGLNKRFATCDIYICVALDECEEIERTFIIPASKLQIVTLCVGRESKYNKYVDDWNFIYNFVNDYESAIAR